MENRIVINFCINTEQDRRTLSFIAKATTREKYRGKIPEADLEAYIEHHFSDPALRAELNNISNQILVAFVDGEVAAYARVTTRGERPEILQGKSAVRIADFAVLERYNGTEAGKRLFERCLCMCQPQQTVWIREYEGNPDLDLFTRYGFVTNRDISGVDELGMQQAYMVKNN